MIIAFVFAFLEGGNLPYVIFYGFMFIYVLGKIMILLNSKNLEIDIVSNKDIYYSGENDEFSIVVSNSGMLPMPCIVVKNLALAELNNKYKGDAVSLGYDDNKWIKSNIKFAVRGIYDLGEVAVEFNDLFFVFKKFQTVKCDRVTKVYPKIHNIEGLVSKGMDIFKTSVSKKSGIEDVYSTLDVRKYQEGDNLKKINWKVSAKYGELFVRNFDMVSGEESNIFLDMSEDNYGFDKTGVLEEQMVDFFVSIVNYMQLKGIETKAFINCSTNRYVTIDSREDFNNLVDFFVTQKSDGIQNFVRFINGNLNKIPKLSWIGIITTKITNRLRDTLISMKDYGYNITVYYSVDSDDQFYNLQLLNKIGIECLNCCDILKKTGE